MTTTKAFVTRHSVAAYFALAFAISWIGFVLVVGLVGAGVWFARRRRQGRMEAT